MCGRIANLATPEELASAFEWVKKADILNIINGPRYNQGPQTLLPAIRVGREGDEWALLKWGLIPGWAKDPSMGNRMINARAESLDDKPAFRTAFNKRRCLIPVNGFYEWKANGSKKQPYFIRMKDGTLLTFAGLWESWRSPEGETTESCTIITTSPNELLAPLHDRMPVIVSPEERDLWLHADDTDITHHVLRPYDADQMEAYPVSTYVNNVRNSGPQCIEPLATLF